MSFRDLERVARVPHNPTAAKVDRLSSGAKDALKETPAPEALPEVSPGTAPEAAPVKP